jgi:hypothetical protein
LANAQSLPLVVIVLPLSSSRPSLSPFSEGVVLPHQ